MSSAFDKWDTWTLEKKVEQLKEYYEDQEEKRERFKLYTGRCLKIVWSVLLSVITALIVKTFVGK